MKIGVVADTHSRPLPKQMLDDFLAVDLIFHVGDLCSLSSIAELKKIKDVKAVYGNMDESSVRRAIPRRDIVKLEKHSIGLFHGEGAPQNLLETVQKEFKNEHVDVVVFGHSHHPFNQVIDGVLYFNPGSPNDMIFAPYRSYGILEINDHIEGKIVKVRTDHG
ncbi:MAG: metallophosphoesterase family protein [Candidatus Omnitrophota bacterium]